MRSLLLTFILPGLFLPACQEPATSPESGPPPNILFIFTDDHASHAISAYGSKINRTPNLDRLADEGLLFRNAFCTNSICGPSRAVILTGKHSHHNGLLRNGFAFDGNQQTAPKILQQAGYQTAMIGKWHLSSDPTGFDFWKVLIGQGPYYNPVLKTPNGKEKHEGYTTDILTDLALDWLQNNRNPKQPFLLMLQQKAPHRSWYPGPDHLNLYDDVEIPEPETLFDDYSQRASGAAKQSMSVAHHLSDHDLKLSPPRGLTPEQRELWDQAYGPKNAAFRQANLTGKERVRWNYQRYIKDYLRCVASVDDNIGRVLNYLDEHGLAENTVVIYSSDQGFYLGDHGWYDKRWMYEESLRMPLLVRWPGHISPNSENRDLVQNLDFAQTFLDLARVDIPEDMQGHSLVPLLRGQRPGDWRKSIYYHYWEYPGVHDVPRHFGVRTHRHKLIHYYQLEEWELFDLKEDPNEMHNLYGSPGTEALTEKLKQELSRLQKLYGDENPEASAAEVEQAWLRSWGAVTETRKIAEGDDFLSPPPNGLQPRGKAFTVGAWCKAEGPNGVLLAMGGETHGFSLYLQDGKPTFAVRTHGELVQVQALKSLPLESWVHLAGVLDRDGNLRLWVQGREVASGPGLFLAAKPAEGWSLGNDPETPVAPYAGSLNWPGEWQHPRLYWGIPEGEELEAWLKP